MLTSTPGNIYVLMIGSVGDQPGSYLQFAETYCPALPCEPFVAGREVRCIVCTI